MRPEETKALSLEEWLKGPCDEDYLELVTIKGVVYAFRVEGDHGGPNEQRNNPT